MRYAKTMMVLIGVGLLLGCKTETNNKSVKLFEIPTAGYPMSAEASGSEQVDALVCQLVSRRPAPYPSGYGEFPVAVDITGCYSTPEVEAAIKNLKQLGPKVFPALVKHLGDDRYSYSGVVQAWVNYRVRDVVLEVLGDDHELYGGYISRKTPSGSTGLMLTFKDYLNARGAEAWAEWAKSKSRLEIQMDFIDWCIVKENERGYVDEAQKKEILENYEAARQRVRKEYSGRDGAANGSQPVRAETNRTSSAAGSTH